MDDLCKDCKNITQDVGVSPMTSEWVGKLLWDADFRNGTSKIKIALTDVLNKTSLAGKAGDAGSLVSSIAPPADDGSFPLKSSIPNARRDGLSQGVPHSCWDIHS